MTTKNCLRIPPRPPAPNVGMGQVLIDRWMLASRNGVAVLPATARRCRPLSIGLLACVCARAGGGNTHAVRYERFALKGWPRGGSRRRANCTYRVVASSLAGDVHARVVAPSIFLGIILGVI